MLVVINNGFSRKLFVPGLHEATQQKGIIIN